MFTDRKPKRRRQETSSAPIVYDVPLETHEQVLAHYEMLSKKEFADDTYQLLEKLKQYPWNGFSMSDIPKITAFLNGMHNDEMDIND